MIEIYVGGNICYVCKMDLNAMYIIMTDDFIKPDTYIEVKLEDGCIGYIRKNSVISFNSISEAERR
jgi:hypothetical protein